MEKLLYVAFFLLICGTVTYSQNKPASPPGKPGSPEVKPASPPGKPSSPEVKPASPPGEPVSPEVKPASPPGKPGSPQVKPASPSSKPDSSKNKCENLKCPAGCQFGTTHEMQNGTCQKCVCSKSPCETMKCANGTVCKVRNHHQHGVRHKGHKDRKGHKHHSNCNGDSCKHKPNNQPVAACVDPSKLGTCPETKPSPNAKACKVDADCSGIGKCCNSACQKPCPKAKCRCYSGSHVEYYNNTRGCHVCKCSKDIKKNQCKLEKDVGPCRASIPKFYFDSESNTCKEFIYGGCGGNENKFDTLEECNKRCSDDSKPKSDSNDTICKQPKETGMCMAAFPRFYFNTNTSSCQQFIYGGCGGNQNNFETKEACQVKCEKKGHAGKNEKDKKDDKHKHKSEHEVVFFNHKCTLKPETGNCRAAFEKYYFDGESKTCKTFTYGGCGGNDNRFDSLESCNKECGEMKGDDGKKTKDEKKKPEDHKSANGTASDDACKQPKVVGKCRAAIRRFYFDAESNSCKEFIYGGCDANQNNFETKEACQAKCEKKSSKDSKDKKGEKETKEDICKLQKERGPCRAAFTKFYYDTKTNSCEEFIYGGCGGNDNRFDNVDDCAKECVKKQDDKKAKDDKKKPDDKKSTEDICTLPAKTGKCRAGFTRYYFNPKNGSCETFIYGGCDANENNFNTKEECEQRCSKKPQPKSSDSKMTDDKKSSNQTDSNDASKAQSPSLKSAPIDDVCQLPKETGSCRAAFPRFYYDSKEKACKNFIYGGCRGNGNNFETLDECKSVCVDSQDDDEEYDDENDEDDN